MTLFSISAAAFVLSEVSIRLRSTTRRHGSRVDSGSILVVIAAIVLGALLATWCRSTQVGAIHSGARVMDVVGIVLVWLGIALRQWAVWVLGRFFTVVVRVSEEQPVIERGPYRWVRHPSYTGLLLTLLGVGAAMENWLAMVALVVLPAIGLAVRIRVEERALLETLGSSYASYAQTRKRLVPGIW